MRVAEQLCHTWQANAATYVGFTAPIRNWGMSNFKGWSVFHGRAPTQVYCVPLSFQSLARVYHCSEPLRNDKSWLRVPTYALSNANQSCQSGGICIPGPTHQGA